MMKTFCVTVRHWRYIQWISCFILWLTVEAWNQFNSIFGCLLACVWRCHARKKNDRWTQQNQSHFYNENFSWKMETKNDNTTTVYRKCNHIYLYALIKCTKVIWTQKKPKYFVHLGRHLLHSVYNKQYGLFDGKK